MVQDKIIREVLALWRQAHAERKTVNDSEDLLPRERFGNLMRRRGWKHFSGGFKGALAKGECVAKFTYAKGDNDHTVKEWNIWKHAPLFKRRFLARCYAYEDGLLIQQYHPDLCRDREDCKIGRRWAERFRILDWGFNHSHRPSGLPVFFDYDNSGSGWAAWRQRLLYRRAA